MARAPASGGVGLNEIASGFNNSPHTQRQQLHGHDDHPLRPWDAQFSACRPNDAWTDGADLPLPSASSDVIGWSRVLLSHTLDAARSY